MSRNNYEEINKLFNSYNKNSNQCFFNNTAKKTFKLLLEIINNKNDEEFNLFLKKYLLNFTFKKQYIHFTKNYYFNSFKNANDLIDKVYCINDENFYLELNIFLETIMANCYDNDNANEYIYLLQEREFIKTNEPIYKIGKSKQENLKRICNYPNGTKLLFQTICYNCDKLEKELIKIFKEKYELQKNIGLEYFKGNYKEMIKDIYAIIFNKEEIIIKSCEIKYSNFTLQQLRNKCKILEITGYSKLNKDELVNILESTLFNFTLQQLRNKCKILEITGYSKLNKDELVNLIFNN